MAQPGRHDEVLTRITEVILGARAELTREEAAAAAGTTVEEARRFWRAMGFPDVGGRAAFTSKPAPTQASAPQSPCCAPSGASRWR